MRERFNSRVPWSLDLSLKDKTAEAGIDFNEFMEQLALNRTDEEMALELAVSEKVIRLLRQHFETHGIQSIVGQD